MKYFVKNHFITAINIVSTFFSFFITIITNILLTPLFVNLMGIEVIGLKSISNIIILFTNVLAVAISSMSARFVSINYFSRNKEKANIYFSSISFGTLILGIIFLIILAVILFLLSIHYANIDITLMFLFVFIQFLLVFLSSSFTLSVFVNDRLYIKSLINVIYSIVNITSLFFLFSLFPPKIYFIALAQLISSIFYYILSLLYFIFDKTLKFSLRDVRLNELFEVIKSGLYNSLQQLINLLVNYFDIIISALIFNPIITGYLATSKIIPRVFNEYASSYNYLVTPSINKFVSDGNLDSVNQYFRNKFFIYGISLSTILIVILVYLNSFLVFWLPGVDINQITSLSSVQIITFIFFTPFGIIYSYYIAKNEIKIYTIFSSLSTLVYILISLSLFFIFSFEPIYLYLANLIALLFKYLIFVFPSFSKMSRFSLIYIYKILILNLIYSLILYLLINTFTKQMIINSLLDLVLYGSTTLLFIYMIFFLFIFIFKKSILK